MSTEQQRQEWRALEQALVPGEWFYDKLQWQCVVSAPNRVIASMHPYSNVGDDEPYAAFIVAAREAVPALLADVDALTAERDALVAELERVRAQLDAAVMEKMEWKAKARHYQNEHEKLGRDIGEQLFGA